ncbi:hypothetical protein FDZ74_00210 [bacterium]|nr:MAG: hypothetical protein FDZ74_00210 [bacterium]
MKFKWFQKEYWTDLVIGHPTQKHLWPQRIWIAVLFLVGLYGWGELLNWGRGPVNFHDWAIITGPRLAYLGHAISLGEWPLHTSLPVVDGGSTLRFLAVPDQILSPQVLLLPWLEIGQFVLLQFWLMYALGFWALLKIRRRFDLSLLAFTLLFGLFSFNGHILTHASVGHATWGGYFLFAPFALLVFDLLDGKAGWRWAAKVAFLAFFMFLQGSYHQFIWLLFFLGLLAICVPRHFWLVAATAVFTVLVSMVRILPAVLLMGEFDHQYFAGYPLIESIWQYMIRLQVPNELTTNLGMTNEIGTWEYTFFIGGIAALFLIYFGLIRPWVEREDDHHFRLLLLPCLGLVLLSLDKVFNIVRDVVPLPLFTGERVASRIFSLAFVFVLIIAVVYLQRWLDRHRPTWEGLTALLALFFVVAYDLQRNLVLWSVQSVSKYSALESFNAELYYPVNQPGDTLYITLLEVGLLVSILSAAGLLFLAWRERRAMTRKPTIVQE